MSRPSYRTALIILFSASLLLSGCFSWWIARPTVAIREIHVTGLTLSGATLTLLVELENPNGFGLTVTAFTYTLYLNDRPVAQGKTIESVELPRRSVTSIPLPLKTSFQDLERGLQSLIGSATVDYRIQGSLEVRSFLGPLEFPYHRTGTIDLKHQRSSGSTPDGPS